MHTMISPKNVESVKGTVVRIIYENEESGYRVILLRLEEDVEEVCNGTIPPFEPGDKIELWGEWVNNFKYGFQFRVDFAEEQRPKTRNAVVKFLLDANIRGVGKKTIERIYDFFGEDTIEIIYSEPERLKEVPKLTDKKFNEIIETLEPQESIKEYMLFLSRLGFTGVTRKIIFEKYKTNTINVIESNPYQLIDDFYGIGFKKADEVAKILGFENDSEFRISAGINHVVKRINESAGNTGMVESDLLDKTSKLLKINKDKIIPVMHEKLKKRSGISSLDVFGTDFVYDKNTLYYEKTIARKIAYKNRMPYIYDPIIDNALNEMEDFDINKLDELQLQAIESAFENMFLVITGGPGTGKTTITKAIVQILDYNEMEYVLAAPTGRAAKRLSESTDKKASTIHRLLKFQPGTKPAYNKYYPLKAKYVIVDEASMIDTDLMYYLIDAISNETALILIGDADQLPSVGPGKVLNDIISSGAKTIRLSKIFRQDGDSDIISNAHKINNQQYPMLNRENGGFYFIETEKDNFNDTMLDLITNRLPKHYEYDPIKDVQVLCPSKKGVFGTIALNKLIQDAVNPKNEKTEYLKIGDREFRLGDKVMQIKNDYDLPVYNSPDPERICGVFNGDIGYIINVENGRVTVEFEDGVKADYNVMNICNLELSYAITIHKSQGSEFKCVVIPVMPVFYMLLNRNIFYTGVTRARENVILVGSKKIIKQMVDSDTTEKRITNLDYLIKKQGY